MSRTRRRTKAMYLDSHFIPSARGNARGGIHNEGFTRNAGKKIDKVVDKKWDSTGPGGKNCPCCTKGKPSEMKRPRRQAIRRHEKQKLAIIIKEEE